MYAVSSFERFRVGSPGQQPLVKAGRPMVEPARTESGTFARRPGFQGNGSGFQPFEGLVDDGAFARGGPGAKPGEVRLGMQFRLQFGEPLLRLAPGKPPGTPIVPRPSHRRFAPAARRGKRLFTQGTGADETGSSGSGMPRIGVAVEGPPVFASQIEQVWRSRGPSGRAARAS